MTPHNNHPPEWILTFFRWFCHPDFQEDIEGDLLERFERRTSQVGIKKAKRGLILDVLKLFRPGLMKSLFSPSLNFYDMYFNHFKIAWRTLLNNRGFAFLNIAGLTLGITCCILIFSFVNFHKSYDTYHDEADRVYRFVTEQHREIVNYTPAITNPFGKLFREEYDYAELVGRVCTREDVLVKVGEENKYKEQVAFAEEDYFKIFKLPLLKGSYKTALTEPGTVILTESLAKKFFGDEEAIGQTLEINGNIPAKVTGVLKDIPMNSDFQTQLYISYSTLPQYNEWYASDDSWGGLSGSMQCFVRLRPGVTLEQVESAVAGYPERFRPGHHNRHVYKLQPLNDVHFSAVYHGVLSKRNLNVLMVIGLFLLVTACFNFINLTTALNFQRIKEVGITKVMGGTRKNLFWRFIAETSIITFTAFALAVVLSRYLIHFINPWLGDTLRFDYLIDKNYLLFLPLLLLFVIFSSGSYPGLSMSKVGLIEALKGAYTSRNHQGYALRKTLIVGQFAISQLLIIGLIIMVAQMKYAQTDLGFTKDAIVMVPVGSHDEKLKTLKQEILKLSGVARVSSCFASPASTGNVWGTNVWYENRQEPELFNIQFKGADEDYLKTFDLELLAGRNLLPSDTMREFIVNETFLTKMNISSPQEVIGKPLAISDRDQSGTIVGVIRDFYDRSFREEKNAICITTSLENYDTYAIRLAGTNFQETIGSVESMWGEKYPEQLFSYQFLDDNLAEFYETESVLLNIIKAFAVVAILIGCLGLFGLISFMAANRKKEIAIRKILGSSIGNILSIFSTEFIKLIFIASLIAVPIGWWAMSRWLESFTYKISPEPWVFATAIGVSVLIAALTIGFQSFRAAIANPVDSLRLNN